MNAKLARLVTRLYPPAWRARYGEEFEAMLELGPGDLRTFIDSIASAVREHIVPTRGGTMDQDPNSFGTMMKHPSAFLPVAMSLTSLTVMLIAIAWDIGHAGHVVHDSDEGAIAHIFQLLMTAQMPIVVFFAVKWLRRAPGQTLRILALQAAAWLAGCAPVYFLHL